MQKDLKIGMGIGLLLALCATVWLATRPSLSTKARLLTAQNSDLQHNPIDQPAPLTIAESNNTPPTTTLQQKPAGPRFHIVSKDETLHAISYKYYGSAKKWQKILDANRDLIKTPDTLVPGTKLIIPQE